MSGFDTAPGTLIATEPKHVVGRETVRLDVMMPTITEFPLMVALSHPAPQVEVDAVAPIGTPPNVIVCVGGFGALSSDTNRREIPTPTPPWFTVEVWPATEIVPERLAPVFVPTVYPTMPFPVPDAPDVTVTNAPGLVVAVQAHPS